MDGFAIFIERFIIKLMEKTAKNSLIATGLTIVVLLAGAGWLLFGKDELPPVGEITIETKKIQETSSEENYEIDAEYPSMSGAGSLRDHRINTDIEKEINQIISNFKRDKAEFETLISENGGANSIITAPTYTLDTSFESPKPAKNIFGIAIYVSSYMASAAHPNNYLLTINYDLDTGFPIELSDLFISDVDYLTILSEKSRGILYKQFAKDLSLMKNQIDAGTSPEEINFESFLATSNGLKILFNPYQVGPYALGTVEISIPWENLAEITTF